MQFLSSVILSTQKNYTLRDISRKYRTTLKNDHALISNSSKWFQAEGNFKLSAITAMAPRENMRERRNRVRRWKKETTLPPRKGKQI
jgi:hypothetical protein